jgi:hypothetical protein
MKKTCPMRRNPGSLPDPRNAPITQLESEEDIIIVQKKQIEFLWINLSLSNRGNWCLRGNIICPSKVLNNVAQCD